MGLGKVEQSLFAPRFLVWGPRWIIVASFKGGTLVEGAGQEGGMMSSILFMLKLRCLGDKNVLRLVGLEKDTIR